MLQLYDDWFTAPSAPPRSVRVVGLLATRPVSGLRALPHRPILTFFIVDVSTKRVVYVGVTRAPTEVWTTQQLPEVTPFGTGPQLACRPADREAEYCAREVFRDGPTWIPGILHPRITPSEAQRAIVTRSGSGCLSEQNHQWLSNRRLNPVEVITNAGKGVS